MGIGPHVIEPLSRPHEAAAESKAPWDYYEILSAIKAEDRF